MSDWEERVYAAARPQPLAIVKAARRAQAARAALHSASTGHNSMPLSSSSSSSVAATSAAAALAASRARGKQQWVWRLASTELPADFRVPDPNLDFTDLFDGSVDAAMQAMEGGA
jgi:hypothetical protein